jgi:hypothetical protein
MVDNDVLNAIYNGRNSRQPSSMVKRRLPIPAVMGPNDGGTPTRALCTLPMKRPVTRSHRGGSTEKTTTMTTTKRGLLRYSWEAKAAMLF